eukprot:g16332.t1
MELHRRRTQDNRSNTCRRGGGGSGGRSLARPRHLPASAMSVLQVLGLFFSCNGGVAAAPPPLEEPANKDRGLDGRVEAVPTFEVALDGGDRSMAEVTTTTAALFSPEWEAGFRMGGPGCDLARGSFMWRGQGFGSNVNNLLNAWVYAIAVEEWTDMAVVVDDHQMANVECGDKDPDNGTTKGWDCLFMPMPHLCTFDTDMAWEIHMVSKHLERGDLAEAARLDQDAVRFHPEIIEQALEGSGTDHLGAKAVMTKFLWSYMTPWLQADVDVVARAPDTDVFETSRFLALHVRRGDKIQLHEAKMHLCEEYLSAAVEYLDGGESELDVEDIRGVWVASDDSGVVDRIKEIAPKYLPNVDNNTIFWASGGVEGGPEISRTSTRTDKETYGGFVYTFADLHQCTSADVFVGTFSSNMGRLLVLLRESIGLKPRSSSISLDGPWWPGRRRQRRVLTP